MKTKDFKVEFTDEEIEKIPEGIHDKVGKYTIDNCDIVLLRRDERPVDEKDNDGVYNYAENDFYAYIRSGKSEKYKFVRSAFEDKGQFWFATGTKGEVISLPSLSSSDPELEKVKGLFTHPRFKRETMAEKVSRGDDIVINALFNKDVAKENETRETLKKLGMEFIRFEQTLDKKANNEIELRKKAKELIDPFVEKAFPMPRVSVPKTGVPVLDGAINATAKKELERIKEAIQGLRGQFTKEVEEYLLHLVENPSKNKPFSILEDDKHIDGLIQSMVQEAAQIEWEFSKGSEELTNRMKEYAEELSRRDAKDRASIKPIGYKHTSQTYADMLIKHFFEKEEIYKEKSEDEKKAFREELSDALLKMAGDIAFERSNRFVDDTIAFLIKHAGEDGVKTEEDVSELIEKHIDEAVAKTKKINGDQKDRVSKLLNERVKTEVVPVLEEKQREEAEPMLKQDEEAQKPADQKKVGKAIGKGALFVAGVVAAGIILAGAGYALDTLIHKEPEPTPEPANFAELGKADANGVLFDVELDGSQLKSFDIQKGTLKVSDEVKSAETGDQEQYAEAFGDAFALRAANSLQNANLLKEVKAASLAATTSVSADQVAVVYPGAGVEAFKGELQEAGMTEDMSATVVTQYESNFSNYYAAKYDESKFDHGSTSHNYPAVFDGYIQGNLETQYFDGNKLYAVTEDRVYEYTLEGVENPSNLSQDELRAAVASASASATVYNTYTQERIKELVQSNKLLTQKTFDQVLAKAANQIPGAKSATVSAIVETAAGKYQSATVTLLYMGYDDVDEKGNADGNVVGVREFAGEKVNAEQGKEVNQDLAIALTIIADSGKAGKGFCVDDQNGVAHGYGTTPSAAKAL